jgi:predicted SPOUT superfamily RNA methylase MTH1
MTRIGSIAFHTFKESVRERVLYNLIVFALLMIGAAILFASISVGVDEIILYRDDIHRNQTKDVQFCADVLSFIETPQYLRKKLFKLNPSLRFTGILPPLQTPHHDVPHSLAEAKVGDVRDGVVTERHGLNMRVDIGLERTIECPGEFPVGKRVTVRLVSLGQNLRGEIIEATNKKRFQASAVPIYWGYKVTKAAQLGALLRNSAFDLTVGTSRYGSPIAEVWPSLSADFKRAGSVLVAFGSPKLGLREILAQENTDPGNVFDYFVNTVPDQRTVTVRTEEALPISLGIFSLARFNQVRL